MLSVKHSCSCIAIAWTAVSRNKYNYTCIQSICKCRYIAETCCELQGKLNLISLKPLKLKVSEFKACAANVESLAGVKNEI